ncbi:hypothetical protein [Mariniluteicoccus flavus]
MMAPGLKVVATSSVNSPLKELRFKQWAPGVMFMALGAVVQVVLDGLGVKAVEKIGNIAKFAEDFDQLGCWADIASAGESVQRGLNVESAAKLTRAFLSCGTPVLLEMLGSARGAAAIIIGILVGAPALFSGLVIGAIQGIFHPDQNEFQVRLDRESARTKGEVFVPNPKAIRSVADAQALLPPELGTFAADQFRRELANICPTGRQPAITLEKVRAHDLVSGSVSQCLEVYAFLWAKTDGRWKVAWAGMADPECSILRRSGVATIPPGFTGAECMEGGRLVPYRAVPPPVTETCSVPVEVFRTGLGNPDVVIRGTRCSTVDPAWARVELAASAAASGNTSSDGIGFAHRVSGTWVYAAAGFRYGRFCDARSDPSFPSDFRAELASECP